MTLFIIIFCRYPEILRRRPSPRPLPWENDLFGKAQTPSISTVLRLFFFCVSDIGALNQLRDSRTALLSASGNNSAMIIKLLYRHT